MTKNFALILSCSGFLDLGSLRLSPVGLPILIVIIVHRWQKKSGCIFLRIMSQNSYRNLESVLVGGIKVRKNAKELFCCVRSFHGFPHFWQGFLSENVDFLRWLSIPLLLRWKIFVVFCWSGPLSGPGRFLFCLLIGSLCVGRKRHRRRGLGMGPRPYCGGAW